MKTSTELVIDSDGITLPTECVTHDIYGYAITEMRVLCSELDEYESSEMTITLIGDAVVFSFYSGGTRTASMTLMIDELFKKAAPAEN